MESISKALIKRRLPEFSSNDYFIETVLKGRQYILTIYSLEKYNRSNGIAYLRKEVTVTQMNGSLSYLIKLVITPKRIHPKLVEKLNHPYRDGKLWAFDYEHHGQCGTVYSRKKTDLLNPAINKFHPDNFKTTSS